MDFDPARIAQQAAIDQAAASMQALAFSIAGYYRGLVECGVGEEAALELARALQDALMRSMILNFLTDVGRSKDPA